MTTIPDDYTDLLDKRVIWHVATFGPGGEIHSSPVWGGFVDGQFVFPHTKGRQKFRNLERNPSVAVSGIDPDNPYRYLEIRGKVVRVDDDSRNAFIDSMAKKYMDVATYPFDLPADGFVVISVEPRHTTHMG